MILDCGLACLCRGLEGLTIGRLASDLKMSTSGLFDHFGSKQELKLATVERATAILWREVPGGCFLTAARSRGRAPIAHPAC